MRISDWSSDVCSSDLPARAGRYRRAQRRDAAHGADAPPRTAEDDRGPAARRIDARRFEARGRHRSCGRKTRPMNTLVVRPTRVRTAGVRQQILLTAQQRLMILMLLFMAAFLVVSVRLLYLDRKSTRMNYSHSCAPS